MRFLAKRSASVAAGLVYGSTDQNRRIRQVLLDEQHGYCAYTEKYVDPLEACDVEHFDDRLKGTPADSCGNWYAVLHKINSRKLRAATIEPQSLFRDRFFQAPGAVEARIRFVAEDNQFEPIDPEDAEAAALIRFLGVNGPDVSVSREKHVDRVLDLFRLAGLDDPESRAAWLRKHPAELSFVSALEAALDTELFHLVTARVAS